MIKNLYTLILGLLAYKVWRTHSEVKKYCNGSANTWSIVILIIEVWKPVVYCFRIIWQWTVQSGAIYSVSLIILLIAFMCTSNIQFIADDAVSASDTCPGSQPANAPLLFAFPAKTEGQPGPHSMEDAGLWLANHSSRHRECQSHHVFLPC